MYKFVLVALLGLLCVSCTPDRKATDEVVFTSVTGVPSDFSKGTFFWRMPKIDNDATLEYAIYLPDGKECYQYTFTKSLKEGQPIRSDFDYTIFNGKHKQLLNTNLTVKIKVNKGNIEFLSKPKFNFSFWKRVGVVQEKKL